MLFIYFYIYIDIHTIEMTLCLNSKIGKIPCACSEKQEVILLVYHAIS